MTKDKVKVIFLTALFLAANLAFAFAQDNPNCEGEDDPDVPCPIDNWVWLLVIVTLVFALICWYRTKRATVKVA